MTTIIFNMKLHLLEDIAHSIKDHFRLIQIILKIFNNSFQFTNCLKLSFKDFLLGIAPVKIIKNIQIRTQP